MGRSCIWLNIFLRIFAREPWVMMAINWLYVAPAARLSTYSTTRMPIKRPICPATEAQSPVFQLCSTRAMIFCMNTEGMELMMALNRMNSKAMGSITG